MKFTLTFAEYSVINAVRGLAAPVVAMLMSAKIDGHRTWGIDASSTALESLRETLMKEIAVTGGTGSGAGILSRVVNKIDDLNPPLTSGAKVPLRPGDESVAKTG